MYKSKLTAFWLCVGVAPAAENVNASMDGGWLTEAASQVLTPKSDRVAPVCVMKQDGKVDFSEGLLANDGRSCRLAYEKGGTKPVVILDFGKQSVGGYAVFTVTAKTGQPVVRLSYPKVRHVKIHATRFGDPSADEAGVYRLQLERVKILKQ
jgi:hypothetical protein